MGLLSAAVKVGDVVKDAIFKYSKKQYTDKITELETLITRLHQHLTQLENLRAEINSFWNDAGSASVIKSLDETIRVTKSKTEHAESLMKSFQQVVEDMNQSQEAMDIALDTANRILSVLGV